MLAVCVSASTPIQSVCESLAIAITHASHAPAQHSVIGPTMPGLEPAIPFPKKKLRDAPTPLIARMMQVVTPVSGRQAAQVRKLTCAGKSCTNMDAIKRTGSPNQTFVPKPAKTARTG
jgi:hypothetical protein